MLVLARKVGQTLVLCENRDIIITVVEVKGTAGNEQIKLAIDAPQAVPIWRQELLDWEKEANGK